MRGRLSKKLVACFKQEFEPRFAQFKLVDTEPGRRWTWLWNIAPNLHLFVVLQAFTREDQFVVNIAWSDSDEVPWAWAGRAEIEQTEGCQRIGVLWNRARNERHEYIWDLAPEKTAADEEHLEARDRGEHLPYADDPPIELVLPRIAPLVHDAIEKLEQYGMPLFRRVAEAHGVKWSDDTPGIGEPLKGEQ